MIFTIVVKFPSIPEQEQFSRDLPGDYGERGNARCTTVGRIKQPMRGTEKTENRSGLDYPATFFACALAFAHRFFAALAIAARPAADKTRFFTTFSSRFVESPKALAAASKPRR
jgi:hypothetical protein